MFLFVDFCIPTGHHTMVVTMARLAKRQRCVLEKMQRHGCLHGIRLSPLNNYEHQKKAHFESCYGEMPP